MRRFSWQTMLIFIISLLLAVILLGLVTAHISKLKQQRRQLSDSSVVDRVNVEPRHQPAWRLVLFSTVCFSRAFAEFSSCNHIPVPLLRVSSDAGDAARKLLSPASTIVAQM
jgi:hypothetical protein